MSTNPEESSGESGNNLPQSENLALKELLGHVPELSARARGGSPMYRWLLACVMLVGALVFVVGIDWGLPSAGVDQYLFGGDEPWTGETIAQLTDADARAPTSQAANIDVDAREATEQQGWVDLTATEADRADLLQRYRLYSHQPDEMTVFQAIKSMNPDARDFDPKMYQYGGLFLYPIAALVWVCSKLNLLTLTPQVSHYVDHPEHIACFYLAARGYVVLFGLLGILAAYKLGSALRDRTAGLVAALLFVLMPVVVNMAHEAKPHLPAAVLTMWAAYMAIRYWQKPGTGRFAGMSVLCGLAVGMVPAAAYALVLIPTTACARPRSTGRIIRRSVVGVVLVVLAYAACNPYVPINLVQNPDLIRSNFVNTSGMYGLSLSVEGAKNALRLTLEGVSPLLALAALLPLLSLGHRRTSPRLLTLAVPALLVFIAMIALGANKPGEFGRFGIYLDVALMLAVAAEISRVMRRSAWAGVLAVLVFVVSTGFYGLRYLQQFRTDATVSNTRLQAAEYLAEVFADQPEGTVGVLADPAPYAVPPLDFTRWNVSLMSRPKDVPWYVALREVPEGPEWLVCCVDRPLSEGTQVGAYVLNKVFRAPRDWAGSYNTIISWANKPVCVWQRVPAES